MDIENICILKKLGIGKNLLKIVCKNLGRFWGSLIKCNCKSIYWFCF